MLFNKRAAILLTIVFVCLAILAVLFFYRSTVIEQSAPAIWRADFSAPQTDGPFIPEGWKLVNKPGTKPASFTVQSDYKSGSFYLDMKADKASSSLITKADSVDLNKTPIMRWRWRVTKLPKNADGRVKSKDDQAIGIYVGTGGALNNKSVSYRWDTETPKGSDGNAAYGLGTVKIKWYTLRNKEDRKNNGWITEERNVAEDFNKAWGFIPNNIYITVSCNSQYTKSESAAELDWIEFRK